MMLPLSGSTEAISKPNTPNRHIRPHQGKETLSKSSDPNPTNPATSANMKNTVSPKQRATNINTRLACHAKSEVSPCERYLALNCKMQTSDLSSEECA